VALILYGCSAVEPKKDDRLIIYGKVTSKIDGTPLVGEYIQASADHPEIYPRGSASTDSNGNYRIEIPKFVLEADLVKFGDSVSYWVYSSVWRILGITFWSYSNTGHGEVSKPLNMTATPNVH
jgi:hypothetical protein